QEEITLKEIREFLDEGESIEGKNSATYRERVVHEKLLTEAHYEFLKAMPTMLINQNLPGLEVREVFVQGPPQNRINLPILAEGYTANEKEKFFEDAARITNDLF